MTTCSAVHLSCLNVSIDSGGFCQIHQEPTHESIRLFPTRYFQKATHLVDISDRFKKLLQKSLQLSEVQSMSNLGLFERKVREKHVHMLRCEIMYIVTKRSISARSLGLGTPQEYLSWATESFHKVPAVIGRAFFMVNNDVNLSI